MVGGHALSAAIGVGARLLIADSGAPFAVPAAIAVATGLSVAAMGALGCQHPAGGGTAFIAVAGGAEVAALGWRFVPSAALGGAAIVAVAVFASAAAAAGRRRRAPAFAYPLRWW